MVEPSTRGTGNVLGTGSDPKVDFVLNGEVGEIDEVVVAVVGDGVVVAVDVDVESKVNEGGNFALETEVEEGLRGVDEGGVVVVAVGIFDVGRGGITSESGWVVAGVSFVSDVVCPSIRCVISFVVLTPASDGVFKISDGVFKVGGLNVETVEVVFECAVELVEVGASGNDLELSESDWSYPSGSSNSSSSSTTTSECCKTSEV